MCGDHLSVCNRRQKVLFEQYSWFLDDLTAIEETEEQLYPFQDHGQSPLVTKGEWGF